METKDSVPPPDGNARPTRSIRWWPAAVLLIAATGALLWIWGWYGVSRQQRNLATANVVFWTTLLLLIWLLFFARARRIVRWVVFGGVLAVSVLLPALFRIRGVTGDLLPILEWRWQQKQIVRLEANKVAAPAAAGRRASTNDYPQFLGPNRNAILPGPALARDWKAEPPTQLWRRPVGAAWSSFAIAGGVAITQEQRGDDEWVVGYDLLRGEPLWSHADKARYHTTIAGEGPRATPTIAGNRVYTLGGTGILNCLELKTGRCVWSKDILRDNQGSTNDWGVSCSPLVIDDIVVVSAGGKNGRSLVAYRKETGDFAWGGGHHGAGYSSPFVATLGNVQQILVFNSAGVTAHAVASGKVLWEYPWPRGHPHVTQPLSLPGDRVLVASGYGTGSELLQIKNESGHWSVTRLWKSNRLKPKFTNLIYLEGFIYGLDDGVMVCLDTTNGDLKWKEGRYGHGQVILIGRLLLVMAESGDVVLLEPAPNEPRELTRFTAFTDKTWNSPALAGEYLLVRNDKEAACYRLPLAQ